MLLIIPVSIYFFLVVFTAGLLMRRLFKLPIESSNQEISALCGLDVGATAGLGLSLLIPLVSLISIFHPIDSWVHFSIVGALIVIVGPRHIAVGLTGAFQNDEWYRNKILLFFAVGSYSWFAFVSAGGSREMLDTPAYHMATVKWVREFGVVPGLTNLMDRLGANSSWHVFAAFLELGPLAGKSMHFAGLLVYMILLTTCMPGFAAILKNKAGLAEIFQSLGFPVILLGAEWLLTSLSTDWPMYVVLFLNLLIVIKTREIKNSNKCYKKATFVIIVSILSATAVSIKFSAAPYALLPLIVALIQKKGIAFNLSIGFLSGLLVLLPFFARNVILSGYLIYPSSIPDFFTVDWKVPKNDIDGFYNWVKNHGYYSNNNSYLSAVAPNDLSITEKATTWYNTWVTQNKSGNKCFDIFGMLILSVVSLFAFVVHVKKNGTTLQTYLLSMILAVCALGIAYGAVSSPTPRYIWIHFALLFLTVVSGVLTIIPINNSSKKMLLVSILSFTSLLIIVSSILNYGPKALLYGQKNGYGADWRNIVSIASERKIELRKIITVNDAIVFAQQNTLYQKSDLTSPRTLVKNIQSGTTLLHEYIRSQFDKKILNSINLGTINDEQGKEYLSEKINLIILGDSLAEISNLEGLKLSSKTTKALNQAPKKNKQNAHINKLILVDAFPFLGEIDSKLFIEDILLWNSALPCSDRVHPYLEFRGSELKSGFRATKNWPLKYYPAGWNDSEIEKVSKKWGIEHVFIW